MCGDWLHSRSNHGCAQALWLSCTAWKLSACGVTGRVLQAEDPDIRKGVAFAVVCKRLARSSVAENILLE